jgi:dipeptidase
MSTYVPIYAGVDEISPFYQRYDPKQFSEDSARWLIDFVDNLLYLEFQNAIEDVRAKRDPLEAEFFEAQAELEKRALELHRESPEKARAFLTDSTRTSMERIVDMYRELRNLLITEYTNNREWL